MKGGDQVHRFGRKTGKGVVDSTGNHKAYISSEVRYLPGAAGYCGRNGNM